MAEATTHQPILDLHTTGTGPPTGHKDSSTLRVSRPMEVVVLNFWVTDTKETLWATSLVSVAKGKIVRQNQHF
jgi:hypothetical protein